MLKENLKRRLQSSSLLLLCGLMLGCGVFSTYSEVYDFKGEVWSSSQVIAFDFTPIKDYGDSDITLGLRYDARAVGSEFVLYVEARTQSGLSHTDSTKVTLPKGGILDIMWRRGIEWQAQEVSLRVGTDRVVDGIMNLSMEVSGAKNN